MELTTNKLDQYQSVKVALESMVNYPDDTKAMLGVFLPEIDNRSRNVALESLSDKIKDGVKKIYEWIKAQVMQFIEFIRSGKTEYAVVKKELDETKNLLSKINDFKTDKITLSPTITGYLAVKGVLSPDFVSSMSYTLSIINKLFDLQPKAVNISKSIIAELKKDKYSENDKESYAGVSDDLLKSIAGLLAPLSSELNSVDPSKNIYNASNFSLTTSKGGKVLDLISNPLPGGYVIQGAYISSISSFSFQNEEGRSRDTLLQLLRTMKPSLTKVYSSGISFSGKALNKNQSRAIIDVAESMLNSISEAFVESSMLEKEMKEILDTAKMIVEQKIDNDLTGILKNLSKFVEMNKSEITRYALRTVRASLRYIRASINDEEQTPISENLRLN